jgi:hypothetical protein
MRPAHFIADQVPGTHPEHSRALPTNAHSRAGIDSGGVAVPCARQWATRSLYQTFLPCTNPVWHESSVGARGYYILYHLDLTKAPTEGAPPDPVLVPFILYNLSAEDRAIMAQQMPPAVSQELVPIVWKEQWAPMVPFLLD